MSSVIQNHFAGMTKGSSQQISIGPDDSFQMKKLGEHLRFAKQFWKHAWGEQITTIDFNLDGENPENME